MPEFVRSLDRGLAVIKAFSAEHASLTLSDVARLTGLTRAAARRFLHTLVELEYVRFDGKLFSLRPRVLELGYAYLSSLSLPQVAQPHMEELVASVRESCSMSVLDGADIVYVARVPTKRIMTVAIDVGTRFPAHATAMGRVLLAAQPDGAHPLVSRETLAVVRSQGWAFVDQELEEGLRSVAVPIRDAGRQVVAALNVSAHADREDTAVENLLPPLRNTARLIEEDLVTRA